MQQDRARHRRVAILDAALRVFCRLGYHEASVEEIAGEARTSKGGVYFHFPNKQAIFLSLLDGAAGQLRVRTEAAIAAERDPVAKADAALWTVLRAFAGHRELARLFLVEALGAGREFHARLLTLHGEFTGMIRAQLDDAVASGAIAPLDTEIAAHAWFGALNEVVTYWVLAGRSNGLEEVYTSLRPMLLGAIGVASPVEGGRR
ncbi:MAG: TetR/AcrR family transcriptional regulator [Dehalococcoidia bacterium]